jgi:hypothetical protein
MFGIRRRLFYPLLCLLPISVAVGVHLRSDAAQPSSITVSFQPMNDSGVTGMATLTAEGDRTRVSLTINGITGDHPDHIHRSTWANPEPVPTYPLSDVVLNPADDMGHSETVVDVPLATLLEEPHLILIHKSHEEINVYVACADIVQSGPMPATGVGATIGERWSSQGPVMALGLAIALLFGVIALRLNRARK